MAETLLGGLAALNAADLAALRERIAKMAAELDALLKKRAAAASTTGSGALNLNDPVVQQKVKDLAQQSGLSVEQFLRLLETARRAAL